MGCVGRSPAGPRGRGARGERPAPGPAPGRPGGLASCGARRGATPAARSTGGRGAGVGVPRAVASEAPASSEDSGSKKRNPGLQVDRLIREELRENGFRSLRRTKIACTIGPASGEYEQLETVRGGPRRGEGDGTSGTAALCSSEALPRAQEAGCRPPQTLD